jgi:hypothetical protein
MKSFSLLKLPVLLLGFGAVLVFSPVCRAQSEIAPDHFDGTDPWETAAHRVVTPKTLQTSAVVQAQNRKAESHSAVQLAAVSEPSQAARQDTVAIQDKRQTAARKPKKQ